MAKAEKKDEKGEVGEQAMELLINFTGVSKLTKLADLGRPDEVKVTKSHCRIVVGIAGESLKNISEGEWVSRMTEMLFWPLKSIERLKVRFEVAKA